MTGGGGTLEYRMLRVPREHGGALIDPPLSAAAALVHQNVIQRQARCYDCQGLRLAELAATARREMMAAARSYTAQYLDVAEPPADDEGPLLATGHQPVLFHPGVWFKSFALSVLGQRLGGRAVHLLVDNDTASSPAVRVPLATAGGPRVTAAPLDGPAPILPYEERPIVDLQQFASFGSRVSRLIKPITPDPLVEPLWRSAVAAAGSGAVLGQCLAQARHRLEAELGLNTLELPLSRICDQPSFRWFAAHLLARLPQLRQIYNRSLQEYRRIHKVRSRSHPVPELAVDGDFEEAPFWVWTRDDPRRRRLFVRSLPRELELTDRERLRLRLSLTEDCAAAEAVQQLGEAAARGLKLRPRALITTMYARLVLCDLFLHGIGGAKYDQLTDLLIARWFGLEPPGFLTLTATAQLPVDAPSAAPGELTRLDQLLRELRYHPEKHAHADPPARALAQEKQAWIGRPPSRDQRRLRHQEIERINQRLQVYVQPQRAQVLAERRQLEAALRERAVLASREYSFCLYPQQTLPALLLELLAEEP